MSERLTDYIVKALIVNEADQALVMVRADDDKNRPGEPDLVGGGLEKDEIKKLAIKEAAIREIEQESGLIIAEQDLSLVYAETRLNREGTDNLIRFLFVARKYQGSIRLSHEHSSFTWCDLPTVSATIAHPVWSRAIDYALENNLV